MRIVQVGNFQHRRYGKTKVSTDRKLFYGFVRNNFRVLDYSDRDIAKYESPLKTRHFGVKVANRRFIETCDNFRPDMLLLGAADLIRNESLAEVRRLLPAVRIAYRNVDPPFEPSNLDKLRYRVHSVDAIFVTTGGEWLRQFVSPRTIVSFMPNPTDPSVEPGRNFERDDFEIDLLFCGIGNRSDPRFALVGRLRDELAPMRFRVFGMYGDPAIWGVDYDNTLAVSKMGLNINRQEGSYLYTSARVSQLMGNGLLTFMSRASGYQRFFSDDEVVYFQDGDDLVQQINTFQHDDARRKAVAKAGWSAYQRHFSAQDVTSYIVETTLGLSYSKDYIWKDQCYRASSS